MGKSGSKQQEKKVQTQKSEVPRDNQKNDLVHRRTKKQKNHVPWDKTLQGADEDGVGESRLGEPVPIYPTRPGERLIEGANNTAILLGRDGSPVTGLSFQSNQKLAITLRDTPNICAPAP